MQIVKVNPEDYLNDPEYRKRLDKLTSERNKDVFGGLIDSLNEMHRWAVNKRRKELAREARLRAKNAGIEGTEVFAPTEKSAKRKLEEKTDSGATKKMKSASDESEIVED